MCDLQLSKLDPTQIVRSCWRVGGARAVGEKEGKIEEKEENERKGEWFGEPIAGMNSYEVLSSEYFELRRFAARAKHIQCAAVQNEEYSGTVESLTIELKALKAQVRAATQCDQKFGNARRVHGFASFCSRHAYRPPKIVTLHVQAVHAVFMNQKRWSYKSRYCIPEIDVSTRVELQLHRCEGRVSTFRRDRSAECDSCGVSCRAGRKRSNLLKHRGAKT